MSWSSELPQELLCRPTGLVVLAGLDITYNAVHKAIWDCFCNNRRPDRVPLQFTVQNIDHEYPKARSKRTSYEWYIPKGTLKTSWMKKHLELIPSVVVVFFDLDWDEHMWKEKQMECATKIEIIRNSLQGRSTRVAVVLIQNNAPLPPGEDVVAAERAASLCSACELSAKSLFVLPHTDHLLGYTIRLENAFYDLAQTYYHTEARRVKAHKEFLNKTTHQLLFVRHQFKIAFYNELKQDTHTALKHYKQAYGHVLDLRMHDTNLLEIKTIAGFINYKICRLSFQHNAPLDAIAQFRKQIDFFKSKVGTSELAFEHSAWMSKQFQVFGDLFDEAIKLGLTAIQTQHPGFYYQQAANHAKNRKQLCQGLCHGSERAGSPSSNPLELLSRLDYYGQRPWRQGHQSIDPPDATKEREGISALQALEHQVDHSWIIIPLLSSAVAQFKKYKSPRMKRQLMVMMGEEYYDACDYLKALTLLSRVTWDYRAERWWNLLTSILKTSLKCAYLTVNIQEYVTIALELIGKYTENSPEDKARVQGNLMKIMMNEEPDPEPGCNSSCVEKARKLWRSETEHCMFTIEMHSIAPFVECKACFVAESFTADVPVTLKVFLRSCSSRAIRFSKLSVLLNNQRTKSNAYNNHCVIVDSKATNDSRLSGEGLCLLPGQIKQHTFSFLPQPEDVGKVLEISSIAVEIGNESTRCAIFHWACAGGDALPPPISQQVNYKPKHKTPAGDSPHWDSIEVTPVTKIEPRKSKMEVSLHHEPPSLVNEFYKLKVVVKNGEGSPISDIQFSFGLKEGQDASLEQTTNVSFEKAEFEQQPVARRTGVSLGSLQSQQQVEKLVYIKGMRTGERMLFAKVSYSIAVDVQGQKIQCNCHKEQTVMLPTVDPFDISLKLASMQFEDVETVHAEEPFLVLTDIRCASPWPIELQSSKIELSPYINFVDDDFETQIEGICLNTEDCASECCCLVTPPGVQATVLMGTYSINWKRKSSGDEVPYVSTTVSLPNTTVEYIPIFVDMDMPAHGNVRTKFPVTYNIYNRTPYSQEIEINIEASEAFMFSGNKQVHFRILPNTKYSLHYSMYPLLPGDVQLPKLHVNMLRYPGTMDSLVQKMLTSHVYIKNSFSTG